MYLYFTDAHHKQKKREKTIKYTVAMWAVCNNLYFCVYFA